MQALYTAHATSTGAGRSGRVATDDGRVDVELAPPKALGGSGEGTNPEQLFAAGYAACFHSALQRVARMARVDLGDSSVVAAVGIGKVGEGFGLEVALDIITPDTPRDLAEELVEKAHTVCPYSNATRGNIDVSLNVVEAADD